MSSSGEDRRGCGVVALPPPPPPEESGEEDREREAMSEAQGFERSNARKGQPCEGVGQ